MAAQIKGGATGPGKRQPASSDGREAQLKVNGANLVSTAKLRAVTDLVSKLTEDLDKVSLLPKGKKILLAPCNVV